MGTMQRKHRRLREAMRREGEPVPSLLVARRRRWWWLAGQWLSLSIGVTRAMASINQARSVVAKAKRAALGLPPHETITITGLPEPISAEKVDEIMRDFGASSGERIKLASNAR